MPNTKLGVLSWIVNQTIVGGSIISYALGERELTGAILSLAIVLLWAPMLTMKFAMSRVRVRARVLGRPVTRSDVVIAAIGSMIVGPILGFLSFIPLGLLTGGPH
ncbi:hypothetical protein [Singulisphaera acidiphila]|uniref:Uncharacterized protein n=1 Tax=Singulisphaera acidiphila (strain ATCC BAA-1392 / DSM 18658 / VKM B-2454 / MOB10) TaxID=886293 RepID=L0DQ40_SINAD|nr:hypothetical protein [Singulisphaera acidiphila]AGA31479.1 hypothetical protein Sinac_7443 [Singulisphaera acidiphila DSM 18658]